MRILWSNCEKGIYRPTSGIDRDKVIKRILSLDTQYQDTQYQYHPGGGGGGGGGPGGSTPHLGSVEGYPPANFH